jgi:hypothetical protein
MLLRILLCASSMERRRRLLCATHRRRSGFLVNVSFLSLSREMMAMRHGSMEMLCLAIGGIRGFKAREEWRSRMVAVGKLSKGPDILTGWQQCKALLSVDERSHSPLILRDQGLLIPQPQGLRQSLKLYSSEKSIR